MEIVVDTREQKELKFRCIGNLTGIVHKKLDVGDYSLVGFEDKISIDRKNPSDLFGTLGKGHTRFKRELERAKDFDYFGIVIEAPFNVIRDKTFEGSHYSKMRGDVVIKILNTLTFKYNVHVHFCNGPGEASSLVRHLLSSFHRLNSI